MKAIRNWVKTTPHLLRLYRASAWRWHVLRDEWSTRLWRHSREVTTPLGFKLTAGVHPAYRQMQAGSFEPGETAAITSALKRCDLFVDIGANLGYYTLIARQHAKPVIAFEPQPQNLQCLYRNLIANGWQNGVEVFPVALAAVPGLLTLYGASGPSASLVKDWAGYSSNFQQIVPVTTLDHVLAGRFAGQRLLVKIDVEGAEYGVLNGAMATLARDPKPEWLIEICLHEFHPGGNPDFMTIFELFWNNGYSASTPEGLEVTRNDVAEWIAMGRTNGGFNYIFRQQVGVLA